MGRPFDKHLDEQELNALVPSSTDEGTRVSRSRVVSVAEAERHVASCAECTRRAARYRQLVDRMEAGMVRHAPQPGCPADIAWHEVAAGLWPELRTRQLLLHAAQCSHCGRLLRASSADEPTAAEEEFLAQLRLPSRPVLPTARVPVPANRTVSIWRRFWDWKVLVPAAALLLLIAVLSAQRSLSSPLSGVDLAQFAAGNHEQHFQGGMPLELKSDSQLLLNQWLHERSEFSLALPALSPDSTEGAAYRLEGARFIEIHNKAAVYIAYRVQMNPVSLIVAPAKLAIATGGLESAFRKVTFHYYTIHGDKVVTWSIHGLTYALVSQEGNKTQRSCMVCHSAMRDRDLSNTPTPLQDSRSMAESFLQ